MGAFSIIGGLFHIGALALLLLGTLTSPVTQSLYLAIDGDRKFGVFGYCNVLKDSCSKVTASNYAVSSLSSSNDYIFADDKRDTFVKVLIVFPVACGLTFFSFLAATSNVSRKSSSSLALSIISIIFAVLAFVASCLACIFVFLVFYPHIKWPAWIQIGSAVLNLIALVFMIINLKINNSTDDLTSMDGDANGNLPGATGDDFYYKNTLLDNEKDQTYVNTTAGFSMPPKSNFNNTSFKSSQMSVDDSSSLTEKKSINDITVLQKRFASSNSQLTNNSNNGTNLNHNNASQPNLYAGPIGSSIRSEAPSFRPQTAQQTREPTLPQIGNPYTLSVADTNSIVVGDDRDVLRAESQEYDDSQLEDNNSLEADSDFTSVSQRAINPRYYHGANNLPPNAQAAPPIAMEGQLPYSGYPPYQQQPRVLPLPQMGQPPQLQQRFAPPPQQYMGQQNPYAQQNPYQGPPPQQPVSPQYHPRYGKRASRPNASDMILQNNPDFMLSQGVARKQMTRYGQQAPPPQQQIRPGQNYLNRQQKNHLPPLSMARDGPYSSFT